MKTLLTILAIITMPIWFIPMMVAITIIVVDDLYDDYTQVHIQP